MTDRNNLTNLDLARLFHDTYERLAPSFGYETRPDTKHFDPESKNGRLMIAVVGEVMDRYDAAATAVEPPGDECAASPYGKHITKIGGRCVYCDIEPKEWRAVWPVVNRGEKP